MILRYLIFSFGDEIRELLRALVTLADWTPALIVAGLLTRITTRRH